MPSSPMSRRLHDHRVRLWAASVAALAAAVAVAAVIVTRSDGGGGYALAAARVTDAAGKVYLSPNGKDSACVRGETAHPCLTFRKAYATARPGDTVVIAGGTYSGHQEIDYDPRKTSPPVIFEPAAGQQVNIDGGLDFEGASYIDFRGSGRVRVHNMDANMHGSHRASYLTISGVRLFGTGDDDPEEPLGGTNYFNSVDHLTLRDVEIGPSCCDLDGLDISIAREGDPNPSNVVLDDVYIHDIELSCADLPATYRSMCHAKPTEEHVDCVQFFGGVNVTIQNSRFFNCSESNVMTGSGNGGTYSNWTLENNLFGPLSHPNNGVDFTDGGPGNSPWSGSIRVVHNSFADGPNGPALIFGEGPGVFQQGTTAYVAGNAHGLSNLCVPDTVNLTVTFVQNVWGSFKCSSRDVTGTVRYRNTSVLDPDLRLAPSSDGIGVVDPSVGPPTDASGAARPRFWDADAGALQREPAMLTLGRTVGPVSLGQPQPAVVAAEGAPSSTRTRSGLTVATYKRFGGTLTVEYAQGRVVAVGTTSPYYATSGGLAAGRPAAGLTAPSGWRTCVKGVRRNVGSAVAIVTVTRARVASIWNIRTAYANDRCEARG
jgi:hypothetical protein